MFELSKVADLNELVQGGQLYCAFPFSKGSLSKVSNFADRTIPDTICLGVRVNQCIRFPPNVFRFLLPARHQWVEPAGGGGEQKAESGRRLAENIYVDLT